MLVVCGGLCDWTLILDRLFRRWANVGLADACLVQELAGKFGDRTVVVLWIG